MHIPQFSIKRLCRYIILKVQALDIWPGPFRSKLLRFAGVKMGKHIHIGGGNIFDSIHPENITIEDNVTISMRCIILSHFVHQRKNKREWTYGKVHIGKNCFLGANVIICQPVTIGNDSAIAAGAVVTKDIPSGEIWGGVPAHFIKKIEE